MKDLRCGRSMNVQSGTELCLFLTRDQFSSDSTFGNVPQSINSPIFHILNSGEKRTEQIKMLYFSVLIFVIAKALFSVSKPKQLPEVFSRDIPPADVHSNFYIHKFHSCLPLENHSLHRANQRPAFWRVYPPGKSTHSVVSHISYSCILVRVVGVVLSGLISNRRR